MWWLERFVEESNRIEGIFESTPEHVAAHIEFLKKAELPTVADMEALVSVLQPDARLRREGQPGVRVGNHIAPESGPEIEKSLEYILRASLEGSPYTNHITYENLHPFTDGNGRSGRALWLWTIRRRGGRTQRMAEDLGFLHTFYYQTLAASDARS